MRKNPDDGENIAYHLQRAFTDGDSNYEAQLLYGRQLFLNGRLEESKTLFRRLSSIRVAPQVLLHPIEGRQFEGKLSRPQGSYAFILRDGPGDSIYVHAQDVAEDIWNALTLGTRVRFRIAFNLRGPQRMCKYRTSRIACSISGRVWLGCRSGERLRSSMLSQPAL